MHVPGLFNSAARHTVYRTSGATGARCTRPASSNTVTRCIASEATGSGGGRGRRSRRAKQPGLFEVEIVTPPPTSLGVHPLPPNTHNGDRIEVEGEDYIVESMVLQYKLVKGRYQREHNRLEVQRMGRYLTNIVLEQLMSK